MFIMDKCWYIGKESEVANFRQQLRKELHINFRMLKISEDPLLLLRLADHQTYSVNSCQ